MFEHLLFPKVFVHQHAGHVHSHRRNAGCLAKKLNVVSSHLEASACHHEQYFQSLFGVCPDVGPPTSGHSVLVESQGRLLGDRRSDESVYCLQLAQG